MRLANKVAIVTGAGSGIGLETSILFAKEGACVVLADINEKAGKSALDQVLKISKNAIFVLCDVSKEDSVRGLVSAAVDRFGKLNIMFNNAGIMHPDDDNALTTPEKVWDLTMNINVKGVWFGCKYAISAMKNSKEPCSIINTASFVALLGAATPQLAYTASKGAVMAMTRELAVIHARESIRVNAICPGPLKTPLLMDFLNTEEKKERRLVHVPMGRFGEAIEIAYAALYLASDESSFVTGTEFNVDGGITAAYEIKLRVSAALALLVSGKVLSVNVPFFFKEVVDLLNVPQDLNVLSVCGTALLGYGGAKLGSILFQEMRNSLFSKVTQKAIRSASKNIFFHVQNLDLGFHLKSPVGGLVRSIERGSRGINQILASIVFHIVPTVFEISLVSVILTSKYGVEYAIVTLTTMASYAIFTFKTTAWRIQFRKQMNTADSQAASVATDSLLNYEAVKYFNNENHELKKYDTALAKYENAAIKTAQSLAFLNAGQNAIFAVSLTTMMWMASGDILGGSLSVGDLVFINGLVFQLSMPLNFLGSVYREIRQAIMDMDTMFKLSNIKSNIEDKSQVIDLDISKGYEIKFENVVFGYSDSRPILNGVSFTIKTGDSIAFVGPSGCGKSTIIRLLFRFFDPDQGRITINGIDIKDIKLESLRKILGVVPQDTILFNQTIGDNISYGKTDASIEEVHAAARRANLHKTITESFPEGYDTQVGERGMMISGGEKQRVQLARVFLKNPPILLFDEPTSALDLNTETSIIATIRGILQEPAVGALPRTSMFIAHRLSTIKECNKIVVLSGGKIQESGTHTELLRLGGVYNEMWNAQQEKVEEVIDKND